MIKKPPKCCKVGTYKCQIPMPISGRVRGIDLCIADICGALNAANIITVASCCGHGDKLGSIHLEDGRELVIVSPGWWGRKGNVETGGDVSKIGDWGNQ